MTLACSEINPERGRRAFQYFRGSGNFHSRVFANRFVANNSHDFQMQLQHVEQQLRTKSVAVQEVKLARYFYEFEYSYRIFKLHFLA